MEDGGCRRSNDGVRRFDGLCASGPDGSLHERRMAVPRDRLRLRLRGSSARQSRQSIATRVRAMYRVTQLFQKLDTVSISAIQTIYTSLVTALLPVFTVGVTLYVVYWGYEMIYGRASLTAGAFVWRMQTPSAVLVNTLTTRIENGDLR